MAVVVTALGLAMAGNADASAASSAPAAAPQVSAGGKASVATNGLRLRSKPGYSGYVKGQLYRGDRLFIRETYASASNPWVGVVLTQRSAGGLPKMTRGYVHKSHIR
ncbi:SH3 domain-containing protein [Streptomyces niveus]